MNMHFKTICEDEILLSPMKRLVRISSLCASLYVL